MDSDKPYVHSTKAYWRNGGYGPSMSALGGTLGLTAAGRVVFTLDSGKVLFSAPVALIKRKNEPMYGWMRFVVGPRLYTLQFYVNSDRAIKMYALGAAPVLGAGMADAQKGRELFREWVDRLDKAQTLAPDTEQIIAAVPTPAILRAREFGMQTMRRSQYTLILPTVPVLVVCLALGFFFGDKSQAALVAVGIGLLATLLVYLKLGALNKQRKQIDESSLAEEDTTVQPADLLPAGTQPTGGFGLTTGKQVLLGFVLPPALLLGMFILYFIVMVIVTIVRRA